MKNASIFPILWIALSPWVSAADAPLPPELAQQVDRLILAGSEESHISVVDDAAFLRRVSLDLAGRPPTPGEITSFGLNPSPSRRSDIVQQLLGSEDYASNWSRYWRDAIFLRATNVRAGLVRPAFEEWMADNLSENRPWDAIVTDLLTAQGPVNDDGSTALIFAHEGESEEIAAEASRLFMGIQIQCANCHDHPWDRWKREQFHELVAFFPRVGVRRDRSSDKMTDYEVVSVDRSRSRRPEVSDFLLNRIDRNRDRFISEAESKGTQLQRLFAGQAKQYVDKNGDGRLSVEEIKTAQPPTANRPGLGSTEHYMPDLSDPGSEGALIHPSFFVGGQSIRKQQDDASRRSAAANLMTSRSNPWFARAIVNRMWAELTGTAFYLPIDDMGPDRSAEHQDALDALCKGFVASNHDLQWLLETITSTQLYQRAINTSAAGFVRLEPTKLRSDQFYDALCRTLNVTSLPLRFTAGRRGPYSRGNDQGRQQFAATFGFDPSTPRDELTGSIPQALFLMNSPELHNFIKADSANSTIARISRRVLTDEDVVSELYLTTVGREPTAKEVKLCIEHIEQSPSRKEGFEDVLWSLLNSSEFQSKS
ncbi:MAG: DUF1549 domain-containing protein [Fuerstiella sp.]